MLNPAHFHTLFMEKWGRKPGLDLSPRTARGPVAWQEAEAARPPGSGFWSGVPGLGHFGRAVQLMGPHRQPPAGVGSPGLCSRRGRGCAPGSEGGPRKGVRGSAGLSPGPGRPWPLRQGFKAATCDSLEPGDITVPCYQGTCWPWEPSSTLQGQAVPGSSQGTVGLSRAPHPRENCGPFVQTADLAALPRPIQSPSEPLAQSLGPGLTTQACIHIHRRAHSHVCVHTLRRPLPTHSPRPRHKAQPRSLDPCLGPRTVTTVLALGTWGLFPAEEGGWAP